MVIAWLLAGLGLAGVAGGLWLGQSRTFSDLAAGAAAGLLLGISIFWLLPEIAGDSGWLAACLLTGGVCVALAGLDYLFLHSHGSASAALAPILAASAVHSFIDGWSVSALANLRIAGVAAPLGLALHKIPEGIAIGWIARRRVESHVQAALAAAGVELLTVVGALVEPWANRSGVAAFGTWWTSGVIAAIAGSFLFFGIHALAPNRRQVNVLGISALTFVLVGTATLVKAGSF